MNAPSDDQRVVVSRFEVISRNLPICLPRARPPCATGLRSMLARELRRRLIPRWVAYTRTGWSPRHSSYHWCQSSIPRVATSRTVAHTLQLHSTIQRLLIVSAIRTPRDPAGEGLLGSGPERLV